MKTHKLCIFILFKRYVSEIIFGDALSKVLTPSHFTLSHPLQEIKGPEGRKNELTHHLH